ncbi:hypothetical protein MMC14_001358 [Varicellaria rhodocarpa]|nr:hypothetical protein [Varicellaria rhodocarpa]
MSHTNEERCNEAHEQLATSRQDRFKLENFLREKEKEIQKLKTELAERQTDIEKLRTTVAVQGKQIQKFPAPSPHRQRVQEGGNYQCPPPAYQSHRSEAHQSSVSISVPGQTTDDPFQEYDSSSRITQLFKVTTEWALKYANTPDAQRERGISAELYTALNNSTIPNQLYKQLASEQDRHLLIAAFINRLIVENIYRVEAFLGFDSQQDQIINDAYQRMQSTSRSTTQRAYQQVIADAISALRRNPCFLIWIQDRCEEFAEWVGNFLSTLIAGAVSKEAVIGLRHIFAEASVLSADLYSVNRSYKFDFIQANRETFYNQHTMLNRDVAVHQNPTNIRREEYRVRLCISPVVVVVDFVGGTVVPKTVHLGEVLLWKP